MTAEIAIMNKEAIALAADSAVTMNINIKNGYPGGLTMKILLGSFLLLKEKW